MCKSYIVIVWFCIFSWLRGQKVSSSSGHALHLLGLENNSQPDTVKIHSLLCKRDAQDKHPILAVYLAAVLGQLYSSFMAVSF